ncbi:hypothetical protein Tco_0862439 [Tanacetum coccineum]
MVEFIVGVSGGVEAILHSLNRLLSEYHNDGSLTMHTMDFLNAFNLKDRSSLLQEQGDPLRHLLFYLVIHLLVHKIIDSCKIILHAWYLDDGTVIGDSEEVARVLDIIKVSGPGLGLELNIKKTEIFLPFCNGVKLHEDHILRDSGICGMDDDYVSALACLRGTIPSFDFSCFTNKDTTPFKAQQNTSECLFSEMIKDMEAHFDMTVRQKAVFESLRAPHAQDFLLAIPINKLGQHMCAGISVKKEAPVNFLTNPSDRRSTLRLADVLVFEWVGGKHMCVDLTGVSPIVGLSGRGFIVVQAALQAASYKVTKHKKACIENQHMFIPFAFDTFGFLAPEAVKLLNRVQRVMNSNVMTPKSTNVVFHRISFAIQKG